MSRGGKRENAGRKAGVPNARTQERTAAIEASGLTPLDYMLGLLRDETTPIDRRDWAAEKAAPYIHARLAAVEHKGEVTLKRANEVTDDELANIASGSSKGTTAPKVDPTKFN